MLSYRHGFHAGNFADVLKHAVLALLVEALGKKATPYCYLDTHSGAGRYDLGSARAGKTGEYREGIARLWGLPGIPEELKPYLEAVHALNPTGTLRDYPGSPRVVRSLLRPQDRMVLMELHSSEYPVLRQEFAGDRQVAVHHVDGYQGLKGFLPPKEKRGLLLMDPSYEVKTEYAQAVEGLKTAHRRWSTGVLALWYPVLAQPGPMQLVAGVADSGIRKVLRVELNPFPADVPGALNGSGMLIVNPPWQLDTRLEQLLPWLWERLSPKEKQGDWRVEWLVPE